jgi:hypothetical protein
MHTHFWGSFDTRLKAEGDKTSRTTVLSIDRHKDADSDGQWGFRLDETDVPDSSKTTLIPRLSDEVETGQRRRVSGKPCRGFAGPLRGADRAWTHPHRPNFPTCPLVTLDQWRSYCDRHGLTDSDSSGSHAESLQPSQNHAPREGAGEAVRQPRLEGRDHD